jgi:hypothetical protein
MKHVTGELRDVIKGYAKKFDAIPDEIFQAKPLRHKWSKQEVLGHLVDSAQNNLRRFICTQYEPEPPLIVYQQDFWVAANQYQEMEKSDLIELWRLLNLRICAVLESMPEANYTKESNTGSLRTLAWLAEDYVKHMKHHINQIIAGSFDVIYT